MSEILGYMRSKRSVCVRSVWRSLGHLDFAIEQHMPPMKHWRSFVYGTSLSDPIIAARDHLKGQSLTHSLAHHGRLHACVHAFAALSCPV